MKLKVIGAGGPRTGTASLKDALEILGFGKTFHMERLFNHPDEVKYWHELFDTGKTDFDKLFNGFASTVDFPGYLNYKILLEKYPAAKVILTERDPNEWYESAINTVHAATPQTIGQKLNILKKMIFSARFRKISKSFLLVEKYLWKGQYRGQFKNKELALQIYNDFNEEVKNHVKADQLLCYKISDGWGPLCEFLDVPVPNAEFPNKNKRKEFKEQMKHMMETGKPLVLK
jgi:hypothetical protein